MHVIAAKAIAFGEALKPNFITYAQSIIYNAKIMAEELMNMDYKLITGGTDTHVILIDLSNKNLTGKYVERRLERAVTRTKKKLVQFDKKCQLVIGVKEVGQQGLTTRGGKKPEINKIS